MRLIYQGHRVKVVIGWTRDVQVKLWDTLRTRAIPERLRGVFMTRRYTNPRLTYLTLPQGQGHRIKNQVIGAQYVHLRVVCLRWEGNLDFKLTSNSSFTTLETPRGSTAYHSFSYSRKPEDWIGYMLQLTLSRMCRRLVTTVPLSLLLNVRSLQERNSCFKVSWLFIHDKLLRNRLDIL